MAWQKQKELLKNRIPSLNDVKEMINNIDNLRNAALISLVYLSAGRINEVVKQLKKKDIIKTEKDGRDILLVRMPNEKNRRRKYKDLPIPLDNPEYQPLVDIIFKYLNTLEENSVLFPFSHIRAYQLFQKYLGINPHFLRHVRATHLVTVHDFNEQLLVRYMGWTDSRPAKHYMELRWQDILDKL